MVDRPHLLPASSTALERAISETLDRLPELGQGAADLHGFKFDPIQPVIPYLIAEYGLGEIDAYIDDPIIVLRDGIAWQRLRGTPAALHMALAWIGDDGVLEENPPERFKWWWFQLHLPVERRSSDFATPMIALAKASKPLRSEFARITAGYDVRGFRLNGSKLNAALLNSWSGVRRAPGEPVLSLRVHQNEAVEYGPALGIVAGEWMFAGRSLLIDGSAPTEQRSGMPSSLATKLADASDPAIVPFSNAPFGDVEFGIPSPTVQSNMVLDPYLAGGAGIALDFSAGLFFVRSAGGTITTGPVGDAISFSRASVGTYIDASGVLQSAAIDALRIDHDGAGTKLGALLEEARTNLVEQSDDLANAAWTKPSTVVTGTTTGADGLTYNRVAANTVDTGHSLMQSMGTIAAASNLALSCRAKAAGYDYFLLAVLKGSGNIYQMFNLATGVVATTKTGTLTSSIAPAGPDGVYAVRLNCTSGASAEAVSWDMQTCVADNISAFTGDNVKGADIAAPQGEIGDTASSYIATGASTAARFADAMKLPLSAFPWNGGNGTLTLDGDAMTPIVSGSDLDISAVAAAAGKTHIKTLKWISA